MSELKKIIERPNHGRVYHLSYRATQQYINAILNPVIGNMVEYRHLIADPSTREVWEKSPANEFGRIMKGFKGGIPGTETMQFIQKHEVPYDKKVTYTRFVCDYSPQKEEKERTIITVGDDRLDYQGGLSNKTSVLTTIKLLLDSLVSSIWAKFVKSDVKNFYLNTPMYEPEYMKIPVRLIPDEIKWNTR